MKKQNKNAPSLLAPLSGMFKAKKLAEQKSRLEAFLDAFPGEYCGISETGSVAYSKGFCNALGMKNVTSFTDIQSHLMPGDAAALEGFYERLNKFGTSFVFEARTNSDKPVKISGSQGRDLQRAEKYNVFWVEDLTAYPKTLAKNDFNEGNELMQVQFALNSIPRPLWLRDTQQNIVWCNNTYSEYLNMSMSDVITEQKEIASQALKLKSKNKNEMQPGRELAQEALSSGEALDVKAHGVFNGKRILMRISEIPLKPLNMTLGIAYNITREEELEIELKRYQTSNKELMEQLRSAIAIFSSDEKLEFYNSAFSQLWGLEGGWLNTGPRLGEIMEKLRETRRLPEQSDFRRFKQSWLDMFTRLIEPHEDMLFLPNGATYRMLVVPHSAGGIMMNFEDVSSRLALESSYNTLIAVQKETLDNLAEAVAVYGGDGRLKLWNPAFATLWSLHPEDLEGEPHITGVVDKMKSFFDEKDWPKKREQMVAKGLGRIMHGGRLERSDDSRIDFATVPLPDGGVLITYTDVTDTVNIEKALREKNAALEAAEQLKMDFLANVSYQLRTPLNAIMGFNEILDQEYFGPLNERQKEYTRDMKEASNRLVSLINDILDLSTLEAGYMTLQREETEICPMMESVLELMNDWARKERIEITLKCPKNIGSIMADERRLKQAMINLIRNAITFTPSGGKILLQASRKKEGLEIIVNDTGIGISKEDRKRIFEPFERAQSGISSTPRLSRSGAGLGLSLVKNIITLHGGTVSLDSEPGKGTTVTLFLPFLSTKTSLKIPVDKKKKS